MLAVRRRVARDQLLAELDLDVAALGDLERAGDRLGPLGERRRHLLVGLQIELVGVERHLRLGERRLRLHAQQRRVVVVVLAPQVVDIAVATSGRPTSRAIRTAPSLTLSWARAVLLDLEVDVLGPEDLDQVVEVRARLVGAVVDEPLREARREAAGQADDALGVLRRPDPGRRRLAALQALEEAGARELDEVAEALVVRGQQRQVVALDLDAGARSAWSSTK